ncbi:Chromatin modification-related protein Eaf7/MRGBP [Heracleum sosnowskyi]|uniref:Chromatin modification-related protein Eaf7/MRGBP n=1 Tax=Heracleum sosnowskyi TaxID=360622 RepID=A0AAD8HYY7_9APIA|nr:Chromatin modification-related protein Eaf7/MRGBP [Heracleum sosnowskyi]
MKLVSGENGIEEEEGMSSHFPCKNPLSSSSSPDKEQSQVEVELKLLEALEIYPLVKLCGIHRHFVLFGLTEYLQRSFSRQFSPSEVLQLLDRFYNLEMLQPDDEEIEILNRDTDFCLPQSFFVKEEP